MQVCYIFRKYILLVLVLVCVVVLSAVIKTDTNIVKANSLLKSGLSQTLTHTLYLPVVYNEPTDSSLPSGTIAIWGQATINGNPAGANIPFVLSYRAHWDYPPSHVLTMTTRNDGRFYSGPIDVLSHCYGMWYEIYEPGSSWWKQVSACEAGMVYTMTAEIGDRFVIDFLVMPEDG